MKTTSIEISKELAEALEKAGYKFNSEFRNVENTILTKSHFDFTFMADLKKFNSFLPAFTICELWDMLPTTVNTHHKEIWEEQICCDRFTFCYYEGLSDSFDDKNPCNALAKLVLWCIENNHTLKLSK